MNVNSLERLVKFLHEVWTLHLLQNFSSLRLLPDALSFSAPGPHSSVLQSSIEGYAVHTIRHYLLKGLVLCLQVSEWGPRFVVLDFQSSGSHHFFRSSNFMEESFAVFGAAGGPLSRLSLYHPMLVTLVHSRQLLPLPYQQHCQLVLLLKLGRLSPIHRFLVRSDSVVICSLLRVCWKDFGFFVAGCLGSLDKGAWARMLFQRLRV